MAVPTNKLNLQSSILALTFFSSMILMEVLTEATFDKFREASEILPSSITFFQFLLCFLIPMLINPNTLKKIPCTITEILPYGVLSILVFGATALATTALNYVPYSVKIVFKSAKLIPTMIVSSCMHKISYTYREYLSALFLCFGAVGYGYDPGKSNAINPNNTYIGVSILIFSSFCDALVPNIQQDMMKLNNIPAEELMVNTNVVGLFCVSFYMTISRDFVKLFYQAKQSPMLLFNLIGIGSSLAVAVICYTILIKNAGSVVAVSIGTLRKIVTIGLSYFLFPKEFLPIHIFSTICVAIGILLEGCKPNKINKEIKGKLSSSNLSDSEQNKL